MSSLPNPGTPGSDPSELLAKAQSERRLKLAELSDLHSAAGAEISNDPRPVLMVAPGMPLSPLRKIGVAFFEGGEHIFLGDSAYLTIQANPQSAPSRVLAKDKPIALPNQLSLSYGKIVALSGDFYGFPDRPVSSDPTGQTFMDAFNSLATNVSSNAEATQILKTMQREIDAVNEAIRNKLDPSVVYDRLGNSLSYSWNYDTGGAYGVFPRGRYLLLASKNWDHFGAFAAQAYAIGHQKAQDAASAAGKLSDPNSRTSGLLLAYAMNAFADHFLTDLFSSGHLRVPRKEMYDTLAPVTGNLCAKLMHDEDSCYGLNVTNRKGESWVAYGDKRLQDKVNKDNLARAEAAVQLSVDEIWAAFQQRGGNASGALDLIPNFSLLTSNPQNTNNNSPFFTAVNGKVALRTPPGNLHSYQWKTDNWDTVSIYMFSGWLANMDKCGERETFVLEKTFLDFSGLVGQDGVTLTLYGPTADGTLGQLGTASPPGSRPYVCLVGDVNRDGLPEVVSMPTLSGPPREGMQIYGLTGETYGLIDTLVLPIVSAGHWVMVDADGAGDDQIALFYMTGTDHRKIALAKYRVENGKIVTLQNVPDLGLGDIVATPTMQQWGYPRFDVVTVDINGDGKNQIVMFYGYEADQKDPSHPVLSTAVFSADAAGNFNLSWKADVPISVLTGDPGGYNNSWWLPVDANGDGKTEIAHVFSYAIGTKRAYGMRLFGPDGAGGYKEISNNLSFGPSQEGGLFSQWLTADMDGDGADEIVLLGKVDYTQNVLLTIYKYQPDGQFHSNLWLYKPQLVDSFQTPPAANCLGAVMIQERDGHSYDQLVFFWTNNGQLTMRVLGGGTRGYKRLADYQLGPYPTTGYIPRQFFALDLALGEVE